MRLRSAHIHQATFASYGHRTRRYQAFFWPKFDEQDVSIVLLMRCAISKSVPHCLHLCKTQQGVL